MFSIERIQLHDRRHVLTALRADLLVREIAELFAPLIEANGQCLEIDINEDVAIFGEEQLLRQALANLVESAVSFCPSGGVIRVAATVLDEGGATLSVTDSGPGIPLTAHKSVLEPFFRLDESRTVPGHGLALTYVDAVMQRHAARLLFEDAQPGFRVVLCFPAGVPDNR